MVGRPFSASIASMSITGARREVEQRRGAAVGAAALHADQRDGGQLLVAVRIDDTEEHVEHVVARMADDEGAAALLAHQDVLGLELADRLAHGAHADTEARRQLRLAGDLLAMLPLARAERFGDLLLDAAVERVARGHGRSCRRLVMASKSSTGL